MKHLSSFFAIFFALFILTFPSCKNEGEYTEWKIINQNWFEQTVNDTAKWKSINRKFGLHQDSSSILNKTESGLYYHVKIQGKMTIPGPTSIVSVKYTGKFIDGTIFESDSLKFTNLPLSGMILGWQEGLTRMRNGGRYILYIPYYLAYGAEGSYKIPPYSTLIFDVQLTNVDNL